jgi:hypothetical protein
MPYKNPEQQREYMRKWMANRRNAWLNENGPCKKCGSWENLEVDHIDPSKKVDHKVWSWSEERRNIELAKCQILCSPCHKKKSKLFYFSKIEHGTYAMRNTWKCECEKCLEYVRRQKRESRARIKLRESNNKIN